MIGGVPNRSHGEDADKGEPHFLLMKKGKRKIKGRVFPSMTKWDIFEMSS